MDALKPSEVLAKAADLIAPKGAWTQLVRARDGRGLWVEPNEPGATCWCLVGAIQLSAGRDASGCYEAPELRWVSKAIRREEPSQWNDASSRKQSAVVSALRKAAELAKAEGQ